MKTAYLIVALIGATVLAYRNTLPGQFIYDDHVIIVENPLIRDLRNIPLILKTSYWGTYIGLPTQFKGGLYRPLTIMSFALNYRMGGLNPRGYHLTNLALHIGVSLLLWLLAMRLGMSWRSAYVVAFLFALLPVHTEAVSNVVGRSEILAAFFVLLSWIEVIGTPDRLEIAFGAAFFGMALLSKESAAAFLPVLIFSDYVTSGKPWKSVIRKRLVIWLACAGTLFLYFEWKYLMLGTFAWAGGIPYFETANGGTILLTMSKFIVEHYFKPLILGISFCADYTRPSLPDASLHNLVAWTDLAILFGLLSGSCFAAIKYKSRGGLYVCLFTLFLLPVLNLFISLEVIGAERFLYLPSIAYCLGFGLFFENFWHARKGLMIGIGAAMLVWYGWKTFERNKAWETEELFWKTTVQDAPGSPRAWNGLGIVLMSQKQYDEAILFYRKALVLNPLLTDARYNIATAHFLQKSYREAKEEYRLVLQEKPFDPGTLYHLAYIEEQERDYRSAARHYAALLQVNPLDQWIMKKVNEMEEKIKRQRVVGDRL